MQDPRRDGVLVRSMITERSRIVECEDNRALVLEFYNARARRDLGAVRRILADDVAWHDPYPPPHGGDFVGAERVIAQIIEAADRITGGSTVLVPFDVLANPLRAVAIVDWRTSIDERDIAGRELAHYEIRDGRIVEAWFYPQNPAASDAFFSAP